MQHLFLHDDVIDEADTEEENHLLMLYMIIKLQSCWRYFIIQEHLQNFPNG